MSLKSEQTEIEDIVTRLLDNLSLTVSSQTGHLGADVRRQIGRVQADYIEMLAEGTFATELLDCFTQTREANVTLRSLTYVHQQLFAEEPAGDIATAIVQAAISFCLAAEARLVAAMTFVSRDDVEIMMKQMRLAFDTARDKAADAIDSANYQQLTFLAGALINHLATASRHLPRMVSFKLARNFPSLAVSMRLYYVSDRAEELAQENHTVHPAFMQRELRGLNR